MRILYSKRPYSPKHYNPY